MDTTPYDTFNGQIGVRLSYLVSDKDLRHDRSLDLIGYEAYKWRTKKHEGFKLRSGLGKGNEVLISWDYIRLRESKWMEIMIQAWGDPVEDRNPMEKHFAIDETGRSEYLKYKCNDGSGLTNKEVDQCVMNVSVLQAFMRLKAERELMHKRAGNSSRGLWPGLLLDLAHFNKVLKARYKGQFHTLPKSERRVRADIAGYQKDGYEYYIDARKRNKSAAIIKEEAQFALLETLMRNGANYNNEEVARLYNVAASVKEGWKPIDASTVANYRKKLGYFITSGNQGLSEWEGRFSHQNKRRAPSVSMVYWTMDAWNAELLYQMDTVNSKGHKVTTYHNRLTVVVILDPVAGIKYPVGFAIGTHETPALITEALRNAADHTRELFGERYKPMQLQSDNYAIKSLSPIYEQMSEYFTPARVANPKAKVIEPWFANVLGKYAKLYYPHNCSGHNVTARAENQPNDQWLDMNKKNFPDEAGCRKQIERLIQIIRDENRAEYLSRWEMLPEADRNSLSSAEYLLLFGNTHTHTNRLQGQGLCPTINGESLCYDTFDTRFRELGYMDWAIKYDPNNLDEILVLNAKCDANRKVEEVFGSHCFLLEKKYIQPMAIYDQQPGDQKMLAKVSSQNKLMKNNIIQRMIEQQAEVETLFEETPALNDTLLKHLITDSTGQHKDQKSRQRIGKGTKTISQPIDTDFEIIEEPIKY